MARGDVWIPPSLLTHTCHLRHRFPRCVLGNYDNLGLTVGE